MDQLDRATQINILKGTLRMKGLSLAAWAEINGYKPVTVRATVSKHWARNPPVFCGIKTQEILIKLQREIEPAEAEPRAVNQ